MKMNIKYCLPVLLLGAALMLASCQNAASDSTDNYATVTLASGTVFTFKLPPNGSSDIYAVRTTSSDSPDVRAYTVSALSASDVPYDSFYIKFVPAYKNSSGTTVGPTAVVRVTEYHSPESSLETAYQPLSRTFNLSSSTELTTDNYHVPVASDGTFEFNWTVDDDNAVKANETFSAYAYKSYSVVSVKVIATLK
jgi:hypothetical protein